jgi:beta-lactamase class A
VLGYSLVHLKRRERCSFRGDEPFPSASTIKVAILGAALAKVSAGEIGYYEAREYTDEMKRGGAGFIQNYKPGTKLELKELLHLMITVSDNSATAMAIRWLGAMEVNRWLDGLGLEQTRLLSQLPESETELRKLADAWGLGVTTPNEMVGLMGALLEGRAGTQAACEEMRRILGHQYFDDGIASQCPPSVKVASKSGALNRSRSDVAIVHSPSGDYILAVFTKNNQDESWTSQNEAERAIRSIAAEVWRHYHPKHPWRPPAGSEAF